MKRPLILLLALLPTSYFLLPPSSPAQQISLSGNYALSGKVSSGATEQLLFFDDFESGDLSNWGYISSGDVTVTTDQHKFGTHAMSIYYFATSPTHPTDDQYVVKYFDTAHGWPDDDGIPHFFMRAYVKFATPTGYSLCGRKCFYITDPTLNWSVFAGGETGSQHWFLTGGGQTNCGAIAYAHTGGSYVFDQWYRVEIEVKPNTPGYGGNGASDGILRMWVDGTKIIDETTAYMRGTCTSGLTKFRVGDQVDDVPNHGDLEEYRYWDDISIYAIQ